MFRNLFAPDSHLMVFMGKLTDCIFLSLFFVLCCFGVVTTGASIAALYDATYRAFRQKERHSWSRFSEVFRSNLKASIIPSILFLACFALLLKGMITLWNSAAAGSTSLLLFSAVAFVAVVIIGILSVLFPMLSRFENSLGALLRNTVMLALANLPRTIALGLLNTVSLFLCVRLVIPLFFLPSLVALFGSYLIEPMFKPYMENNE